MRAAIITAFSFMLAGAGLSSAQAGQVHVAVAANFTEPANAIAAAFRKKTGHEAILSFGSTAQFYTQIRQDAPFHVFLSADEARPKALAEEGFGVPESRFTYAIGQLVLWTRTSNAPIGEQTLRDGAFAKIAIANPVAAPYGAAAIEVMKSLNVYDTLKPKIVEGANISQAFQFVDTGNAEIGFVAAAQIVNAKGGSGWFVPRNLYSPIRQDAILIKKGEGNGAATAFMDFLKSHEARAIIKEFGYLQN